MIVEIHTIFYGNWKWETLFFTLNFHLLIYVQMLYEEEEILEYLELLYL